MVTEEERLRWRPASSAVSRVASPAAVEVLGGLMGGLPAAAPPKPPPAPPAAPKPTGPTKVGGNVVAANLINSCDSLFILLWPRWLASRGTVKFEAMISKEGTIEDLVGR